MKPQYFHYGSLSSTNDVAKEKLAEADTVLVSADMQTRGRGRNGKSWLGNGKNIFCSLGIRHRARVGFAEISGYQYRACLAVLETLRSAFPQQKFALKYPNDIYALENKIGKKISGILVENEFQGESCSTSIVGIGINVSQEDFPEELRESATSLRLLGENTDASELLQSFIPILERCMSSDYNEILRLWKRELNLVGKAILSKSDNREYNVLDFDEIGRLIAVNGGNKRVFDNGDSIRYTIFAG